MYLVKDVTDSSTAHLTRDKQAINGTFLVDKLVVRALLPNLEG